MNAQGQLSKDYKIISSQPDFHIEVVEETPFEVTCVTNTDVFNKQLIKHMNQNTVEKTLTTVESEDKDENLKTLTYNVKSMSKNDEGIYTCHAMSIAGSTLPNGEKRKRKIKVSMKGNALVNLIF